MSDPEDKPSFKVQDRRRVDGRGRRRRPIEPQGRTRIEFKDIDKPLKLAFDYFRAQLLHAPTWPPKGSLRDLPRAFVISTQQLYASTLILLDHKRPFQLVVGAGVVARALVEGIGNVFALLEDPDAAGPLFLRDDYLNLYRNLRAKGSAFDDAAAQELRQFGWGRGLTREETEDPEGMLREWPLPTRLLRRQDPPRLVGERRTVFQALYRYWYRALSALSHHRMSALDAAIVTEDSDDGPVAEAFVLAQSATATLAILCSLAVLSEVEAFYGIDACRPLRTVWELVRDMDDLSRSVYASRYARLLRMELKAEP